MSKVGEASDSSQEPLIVYIVVFLLIPTLTYFIYTNPRFGAPSQHGKWDDILQEELPIDAILIHKLPRM